MFRRGDVLLNIGSTWWQPSYPEILDEIRSKTGLHFVLLVHDVIPWRAPQFCTTATVADFVPWMRRIMPSAAKLLTISSCSRTDILAFLKAFDIPEKEVAIIRWGYHRSGNRHETSADEPLPARFVLSVGTVEARKNHILLVRVWSRLLERHDPSLVPQLVWAGRQGWMIDALCGEIAETDFLGGKLVWLGQKDGLAESTLHALYRDCLFTMFPSFYEGWGLPVSESLAYGKFCIASKASAIPEAGGDLIDYHRPEDLAKCLELTERAIFDPAYRASRERRIRQEFKLPSWAECAHSLMKACNDH
jgi:glycosyltransferase involved in cell wall biosynthesis